MIATWNGCQNELDGDLPEWTGARIAALPPVLEPGRGPALITGPLSSESLLGRYRPPSSPLGRCQLVKTRRPFDGRGPGRAGPPPARWRGPPGRRGGAGPGPERKCINKLHNTWQKVIKYCLYLKISKTIRLIFKTILFVFKTRTSKCFFQFNNNGRVRNKKW